MVGGPTMSRPLRRFDPANPALVAIAGQPVWPSGWQRQGFEKSSIPLPKCTRAVPSPLSMKSASSGWVRLPCDRPTVL